MQDTASANASRRICPASSVERAGRGGDRRRAEQRRDRGGEGRAEDDQQREQQQRQRDQLGAMHGRQGGRRAVAGQQRQAGDGRSHRGLGGAPDERLDALAARGDLVVRAGDRDEQQRAVARRAQRALAGGGGPWAQHAQAGPLGESRGERLALRLDVRARAAQQHRDRGRVAEVAADQGASPRGLRARHLQPTRRELAVDAEPDGREHGDDENPRCQDDPRLGDGKACERGRGPAATTVGRLHRKSPCERSSGGLSTAGC